MQLQNLQFNLLQIIITCFDRGLYFKVFIQESTSFLYSQHSSLCLIVRRCFECQHVFEMRIIILLFVILWSSCIAVFLLSGKSSYLNRCLSFVFENNFTYILDGDGHDIDQLPGASWDMQIRTLKQDVPLPHSLEQSKTKMSTLEVCIFVKVLVVLSIFKNFLFLF